jgi:hypothetical protein
MKRINRGLPDGIKLHKSREPQQSELGKFYLIDHNDQDSVICSHISNLEFLETFVQYWGEQQGEEKLMTKLRDGATAKLLKM